MDDSVLRASLVELLRGGNAYVTAEKALADVEPELRNARAGEGLHSVWEELEHIRIAQEDILRYTLDAAWKSPKWPDGYWPARRERVTDDVWAASVAGFVADREKVIALVEDPGIDLTAQIPHGEGRTYLREVLLIADHNAYHLGQVVQTRKALVDWTA
jgi:uncharacterized damage-inducible protein DinB